MKITILTLFPEMFEGFTNTSIIKRAIEKDIVSIKCVDIRKYTKDKHNHVDDTPFGGGQGMVMQCQPVIDAIKDNKGPNAKVIMMAPFGKTFNQKIAHELAEKKDIVLLCGHYEGMDARIEKYVDEFISIGDYILTGGELASMVVSDAIIRLQEGAIDENSASEESFEEGLLEHPQYTKPAIYEDMVVPEVLLSGHHANIAKYNHEESLRRTYKYRKDLLEKYPLNEEDKAFIEKLKENDE